MSSKLRRIFQSGKAWIYLLPFGGLSDLSDLQILSDGILYRF